MNEPVERTIVLLEDGTLDDVAALLAARAGWAAEASATLRPFVPSPASTESATPALLTLVDLPASSTLPDALPGMPTRAGLVVRSAAAYRRLRTVEGSVDGPSTRGLLIGLTDCGDPAREDEFHRWYDVHHAADVVRSGRYFRGVRYERIDGGSPRFLAAYETSGDEPTTFRDYLAWPERDRTRCDVAVIRSVWTFRAVR